MSLHGWVIYNGFLPGDKFKDFAQMLQEAALEKGHDLDIKTNDQIINNITGFTLEKKPDYVLFIDKDIYLAKTLEAAGIPVFNKAESIEISDDKIKTYEYLVGANIPIPKTIVAPKTFGYEIDSQNKFLKHVINYFEYPFLMKEAFGSFGEQVYLVTEEADLHYYLRKIAGASFVFQEYIHTSFGSDIRLQVVGSEVVAAMKRTSIDDFRSNVSSGGRMQAYTPNDDEKKLAIAATKVIGADFAGVDLLFGANHERFVCEVNSNAHIRNLYDCTNINTAPYIIDHIENVLRT